jgi:proline dehydrogenase
LLRSAILFASENQFLRSWFERSKSASLLTRRFVAGNSLEEATNAIDALAREGLSASLDALGESVRSESEAKRAAQQYIDSVQRIHELALPATVSLKLTQLGLGISHRIASDNLGSIVEAGRRAGIRVEVDMEASEHVDATLELVKDIHDRMGCIRAVMQAYLYRTENDVHVLNALRIPVRLCKGAYKEGDAIAWPRKADVDANYRKLTSLLLEQGTDAEACRCGSPQIGTGRGSV